ncbi:Integrator complex subunit 1 [Gamsiella multidivaricata]|nr:Integrator complex subunit 1 [Gamsiella multidivaricata]
MGRAPSRPIKSSSKLEPQLLKGISSSTASPSAHTPPLDSPSQSTPDSSNEGASLPAQKRVRISSASTGSNSAPSTPPRIKTEESTLKSALRKLPAQQTQGYHQHQEQQTGPKSLWSLTRNVKIEQETVYKSFSRTSWETPPPFQHIRAALQYLKFNALKPDPVITSGLLRLGQAMPALLRDQTISTIMIQMLRPEFTHSFKIRTNGAVVFLICALLHLAWNEIEDWPTDFVMAYLEDALGERSWCAHADTETFVRNILTAFRTDDPLSSAEEKLDAVRLDEKTTASAVMVTIDFHQYTKSLSVRKRYNEPGAKHNIKQVTLQTMWEHIPMAIGVSAVETSVRSLIKVMIVTCRWVEVRLKAMSCMEFWLGSFLKSAKPLLRLVLRQISTQEVMSKEDLEAWTMLLDFRYKGRPHQVETVKEELRVVLLGLSSGELIRAGLNHIMEVEMNPNELKNPYHLDLMELLLQAIPDNPGVAFGQLIQGYVTDAALHMGGSAVSPPLAPIILVVKRWIRHLGKRSLSWTADLVVGLLKDGPSITRLGQKQEQQQHLHIPPGGRNIPTLWLLLVTEVVCNVMMATAMEAKEMKDIKASKFSIEHVHSFTLRWFQTISNVGAVVGVPSEGDICKTPFGPIPLNALRTCITRLLFLDPPQSYAMDSSSQEFDTTLICKVIENGLPLTEAGLSALLGIRLPHKMLLSIVGEYVSRATDLSRFYPESCAVKNPEIVVKIFDLSRFCETNNSQVLKLATLVVWDSMPVVRTLLEICISQHYSFPPPNYTPRSEPSSERLLRLSIQADQKDQECVLAWEKDAIVVQGEWNESRGDATLQLSESEYVGWLMCLDFGPSQPARAPPPEIMQQLRGMNERFGLGMKLASSRDPDYLGRMVGSNDDAAWVDRLLREVPEILNALPASTLCARYCRSIVMGHKGAAGVKGEPSTTGGAVDSNVQRKLVGYLESVMDNDNMHGVVYDHPTQDPLQRFQEVRDIFEYFLIRLCPLPSLGASEAEDTVQGTKLAMNALFKGDLSWPNVLLRTVYRTPETGFFSKCLQWIENFVASETSIEWLARSLNFLLQVDGGEGEQVLEQSLLTISRLLTGRLFVFEWVVNERVGILRKLAGRVNEFFARQDSIMENVSVTGADRVMPLTPVRPKVQVELSGGMMMSTYPEILRLALLMLSVGDINKQTDSTWSRLFKDSSQTDPGIPKRLKNGAALLSCDPPMQNDLQFRLRLVQYTQYIEVVRVAMDGLSLVEVIDLSKEAFGVDVKIAQVMHEVLLTAMEEEKQHNVPVHLEKATSQRLLVLLKYYADQGSSSSQSTWDIIRTRIAFKSLSVSTPMATQTAAAVLPNFFELAARE